VIRRELAFASETTLRGSEKPFAKELVNQLDEPGLRPGLTLEEAERRLLETTLLATGGNRTRAAEMMGVSLRTVRNKIREYGLAARRAS
jgi:DNA-binding protein Fis